MSTLVDKIDLISRWVVKLAYLNILWFLFCIAGGVILGWAPATVGVFTILKKWDEEGHIPIFSTFFYTYKKAFIKSNISGLAIELLAIIFLANFYILFQQPNTNISRFFLIGNGTLITMFILSLTIFFPIYVHYQGEYKVILSEVIFTTLGKLPITILNLILCGLWGGILFYFPGLIFFFCISIPALIITLISQHCFKRRSYTLNIN